MAPRAAPTRLLRAFAHFVLAALAVFLLLVLSTLLALRTPWGSRLLLAQLLPRINAEILGRVDVARLSVSPRRLTLLGLSLRDPKGKEVLKATRVQVSLSPWSLLHRVVEISSAEIVAPEVDLHIDERGGSDLSRAVAPRQHEGTSKASGTSGTERPWSFELGQLTVRDGHLSITDERAPPDSAWGSVRFRLAVFHLDGQLSGEAPARFKLDLDLRGELERPFRAPVRLSLAGASADRNASRAEANASLTIGRSTAEVGAHARLDGGLRAAEVTLDRIRVDPRLLKAVLPSSPIDTAIVGSGTLGWNGESGDVRAKVRLAAGEAKLSLAARANTNTRALDNLTLKADSVDLARLVHGAPTSDLSIECRARGAGTSLADLDGELTLRIPRGRLDGHLAGPVRLTAEATRGRLHLSELFVSAPGATLAASGTATPSALSLRGTIDLADLGALLQSISSDAKAAPAQGRGRLAFELSGSPTNPSIRVGGRLSGLAANELSLPSLSLELRVPSARNPLASALALRIPEARLGQRVFQGLSLRLAGTGPMFALHVALSRPEPVVLRIGGHWSSGHRRLSISTAQLALARATWSLRRTAELDLSEARTRLSELRLSASNQSIGIALDQRPHDLHARVSLSRLDLALLPQRLLSIPHLAGQLSADLDVRQTRASRRGKGHVDLAQARIGTIDRIDAAVDAELSGDRVDARFTLGALGARAKGQLDLPARWPPRPGSGVSADLDLTAVGLDRVMSALSRTHVFADRPMPKLVGAGSATVRMRGTAERPDVLLDLRIEGLRWQDRALGELQVGLRTGREDGLAARLALTSPSTQGLGTISLDVHGKGRPPSFLTSPNALRELAAQPIEAELHAERVALPAVAQLLGRPAVSGGTAKLSARFVGDVDQGRGDVAVDIIGFAVAGIPATDGKLRLVLREHDLQAELHVTRKQASLLSANATVRAPLARLVRSSTLAETPVELHATLGPLEWQHVGVVSAVGRPRVLHGHLGAELAVGGTLGRPNLRATAKTRDVRLDDMPAGAADALVDYEDGVLETYLTLVSSDGGRLLATASLNADLGYPAALHLPPSRELPVEASLQATRFDLAALSGLSPTLEGSTLRFSGSPELPALDVTAQYVSGEGDVTVVATVKGSPGHLETALTAPGHPELTESQLYTLVVTGHLGFGSSSSAPSTRAGQAESLLGGLLASQLQTLAANKLPFDVLTIQTGATAGSARVEAGKYVTSDLYVGYVARVGADPTLLQNRNAVHFEYALGSHWSFQGEYGDAKTGSLDLFWTKRY